MGWSMIAVIIFNVSVNFGYVTSLSVVNLCRRLKYRYIRCKKLEEANERAQRMHRAQLERKE